MMNVDLPPWVDAINRDDRNAQNNNAGNGGDLVKHTVYLALLDELLRREPWRTEIRLRECHAGRGVYLTTPDNAWLIMCLSRFGRETTLGGAQDDGLFALGLRNDRPGSLYAGSAVLNLRALSGCRQARAEFYEQKPATREVLKGVLRESITEQPEITISVPGAKGRSFDGEVRIADKIAGWDERDVVLLDPFAMWSQSKDQRRRDLYRGILDGALERGCPLSLFFTWGNANPRADADMNRSSDGPRNGYVEMLDWLGTAGASVVVVRWVWKLRFAMWLVLPNSAPQGHELRDALAARLRRELNELDRFAKSAPLMRKYPETLVQVLEV